jgi:hypothetical protein
MQKCTEEKRQPYQDEQVPRTVEKRRQIARVFLHPVNDAQCAHKHEHATEQNFNQHGH